MKMHVQQTHSETKTLNCCQYFDKGFTKLMSPTEIVIKVLCTSEKENFHVTYATKVSLRGGCWKAIK